jgi:predicted RNA-binding protein with RPS1 domain
MGPSNTVDYRNDLTPGTEIKVAVLSIEDGGKRIRLSRAQALRMEEDAETKSYIDTSRKGTGFGMTVGEALRRSRR